MTECDYYVIPIAYVKKKNQCQNPYYMYKADIDLLFLM